VAKRNRQKVKNEHENLLLVEGDNERFTIPELVEANGFNWVIGKDKYLVYIDDYGGGDTKIVKSAVISTELNVAGRKALGLIVDADNDCGKRWQSIRNACIKIIPDLPQDLPETGLIHNAFTKSGKPVKFGVWIMPDNKTRGMLETFLAYLVPNESATLWQYTKQTVIEAKDNGANYKQTHLDKANIYTWLAWQNPPGRQLHNAVMEKILNPHHPKARVFIKWFRDLYNLSEITE
jgi:hypothetical protein